MSWPDRSAVPVRWRLISATLAGLTLLALPACGGPGDSAEHPILELTTCQAAFSDLSAARAGDENFSVERASQRTLEACSSRDEWLDAAAELPEALPTGAEPAAFLDELCAVPEHADASACSGT
ncbi:hypothetical protein [Cellulomonas sp. Marseille-Q8402]